MIRLTIFVFCCLLLSFSLHGQDLMLDKSLVDLKGQISTTVIKNSTSDTLKLKIRGFYYLPYYETSSDVIIAPGNMD